MRLFYCINPHNGMTGSGKKELKKQTTSTIKLTIGSKKRSDNIQQTCQDVCQMWPEGLGVYAVNKTAGISSF